MTNPPIDLPHRLRFQIALVVAMAADAIQWVLFPIFVEGAASPTEDALDAGIAAILFLLLGWQWELAPSALAKLVPGVDMVPFWTLAVANIYRKTKNLANTSEPPPTNN
ncbi:MAG: hypothetical protein V4555_19390 [Acidobacteriota bacterium]